MRVNEREGARAGEGVGRRQAGPARRFGDALRRAGTPRGKGAAPSAAEGARASVAARTPTTRRAAADRAGEALRDRREAFREEARSALPPPGEATAPARAAEPLSTPELRALVRTLPLAIQTFGLREGAPLALSFGRSLDVEIRPAARGVELVLRPEPRLVRASEAELRGVVAALEARGITVARATVRVRRPGSPAGGARVDLAAGVR